MTTRVLSLNPEFQTGWSVRRRILLDGILAQACAPSPFSLSPPADRSRPSQRRRNTAAPPRSRPSAHECLAQAQPEELQRVGASKVGAGDDAGCGLGDGDEDGRFVSGKGRAELCVFPSVSPILSSHGTDERRVLQSTRGTTAATSSSPSPPFLHPPPRLAQNLSLNRRPPPNSPSRRARSRQTLATFRRGTTGRSCLRGCGRRRDGGRRRRRG